MTTASEEPTIEQLLAQAERLQKRAGAISLQAYCKAWCDWVDSLQDEFGFEGYDDTVLRAAIAQRLRDEAPCAVLDVIRDSGAPLSCGRITPEGKIGLGWFHPVTRKRILLAELGPQDALEIAGMLQYAFESSPSVPDARDAALLLRLADWCERLPSTHALVVGELRAMARGERPLP